MDTQLAVSEDDGEYYFEEEFSVPLDQPLCPLYESDDFGEYIGFRYKPCDLNYENSGNRNHISVAENDNSKSATLPNVRRSEKQLDSSQTPCFDSQLSVYRENNAPPAFNYHHLTFSETSCLSDVLSDVNFSYRPVEVERQRVVIDSPEHSSNTNLQVLHSPTQSTWKQLKEASKSSLLSTNSQTVSTKTVQLRHNVRDLRRRRAGADALSGSLLNIYQEEQRRMDQNSSLKPSQSPSSHLRTSWYSRLPHDGTRSAIMDDVAVQTEPIEYNQIEFLMHDEEYSPPVHSMMSNSTDFNSSGQATAARAYIKNTPSYVRHPHGHIHQKRPQSLAFTSSGAPLQAKYFLGRSPSEEHMNRLSKLFTGPGVRKSQENLASLIPSDSNETIEPTQPIASKPPPKPPKTGRSQSETPRTPRPNSGQTISVPCNTRLPLQSANELPDLSFLKPRNEPMSNERRSSWLTRKNSGSKKNIYSSHPADINGLMGRESTNSSALQTRRQSSDQQGSTDYRSLTNLNETSCNLLLDRGLCTDCAAILGQNLSALAVPLLLDALEKHASVPNLAKQDEDSFVETEISDKLSGEFQEDIRVTNVPEKVRFYDGLSQEKFRYSSSSVRRFASVAQLPSSNKEDSNHRSKRRGKITTKGVARQESSPEPRSMFTSETHSPKQLGFSPPIQRTSTTSSSVSFISDAVGNNPKKSVSFSEIVKMHTVTGKDLRQQQQSKTEEQTLEISSSATERESSLTTDSTELKVIPRSYGVYGEEAVLAKFVLSPDNRPDASNNSKSIPGKSSSATKEKPTSSTAQKGLVEELVLSTNELISMYSTEQSKGSNSSESSMSQALNKSLERFIDSLWNFLTDGMASVGARMPLFSKQRPKIWSLIEETCRLGSMAHLLSSTFASSRIGNPSSGKMDRTLFYSFICNLLNQKCLSTWLESMSSNKMILKKYYQGNALIIQSRSNNIPSDIQEVYSTMFTNFEQLKQISFKLALSQLPPSSSPSLKKTPSTLKKYSTLPNGMSLQTSSPIRGRHDTSLTSTPAPVISKNSKITKPMSK